MRTVLAFFLAIGLLTIPAVADDPDNGQAPPAQSPARTARDASLSAALHAIPVPPGMVNGCGRFHPATKLADDAAGATLLDVHIGADGLVSGARVRSSSGDAAYDAAAVACANASFIQPPTQDKHPVAVDWVGRIDWRRPPNTTYLGIAMRDESRRVCLNYPDLARRMNEEGVTAITFDVAPDGTTQNFSVALSSGYQDLDDAAQWCFARYLFYPARQDDKPVVIGWRGIQAFRLH